MVMLDYLKTERLMKKYRIPTPAQFLAKSEDSALRYARLIGFPVAIKIVSPEIIHKTEVKGIFLDIENEDELLKSYRKLMANVKKRHKKARIDGILVQKFLKGKYSNRNRLLEPLN